ncbi:hypothetical protein [Salinifilum aidingensis]
MPTRTRTHLLHEVWQALDDIVPAGRTASLAESGMVAAASTDGAVVRALLRVPTTLRGRGPTGDLLSDVVEALEVLPSFSDIELNVKPSRPAWTVGQPAYDAVWDAHAASMAPAAHTACAQQAAPDLSRMGWVLDAEHATGGERTPAFDKVCVIIHAHIRPDETLLASA